MQVGPLAQVLVGYAAGHEPTKRWADLALKTVSAIAKVQVTPAMLHSTLGRHAARAIRSAVIAELALKHWELLVDNIAQGRHRHLQPADVPEGRAARLRLPRGAARHAVALGRSSRTARSRTTRRSCRRPGTPARATSKDQKGPYEASLVGNPVADPERPLEVLRTVHSFDPCLACAIHTLDPEGKEIARVKVL